MKKTTYLVFLCLFCTLLTGCASSKPAQPPAEPAYGAMPDTLDYGEIPMVVEDMPMLIGGLGTIQRRVTFPDHLSKQGINGRVFIQFVVDVKGNITQLKVMRSLHPELDRIALDAVAQARFKPGKQKGVPVPVKMSLPITFKSK